MSIKNQKSRMTLTSLSKILMAGFLIALVGCQATTKPTPPAKPNLKVIEFNGGICLDAADSIALGKYLIELESLAQ